MTHTTSEFQLPIPFAYFEATIPAGTTINDYQRSRPQRSSWWRRLQPKVGRA